MFPFKDAERQIFERVVASEREDHFTRRLAMILLFADKLRTCILIGRQEAV